MLIPSAYRKRLSRQVIWWRKSNDLCHNLFVNYCRQNAEGHVLFNAVHKLFSIEMEPSFWYHEKDTRKGIANSYYRSLCIKCDHMRMEIGLAWKLTCICDKNVLILKLIINKSPISPINLPMLVCFIWVTKRKKSSYEATYIIPLLALYKYVYMPLNMYTVKTHFQRFK